MTGRYPDELLDRLRLVGDEPADRVARGLLTAYAADEGADETEIVGRVVRQVLRGEAAEDDDVRRWFLEGPDLPSWADPDLVAAGQRFFSRWPLPICTALFCAALPTAYAAPHGAAVMVATSQLGERPHVAARLAGTGRMIFDVMGDTPPGALRPGRQGYLSARGVRLLHAVVRQALLSAPDPWPEVHGAPINQEDLLGTLMSFTVTVVDALEVLGVPVRPEEEHAYLHAWCVVGALLGIDEAQLPRDPAEARELTAAITARQVQPGTAGRKLVDDLLREMRLGMPPGCQRLPAALMHHLVPDVARLLRVPAPGPVWRWTIGTACSVARRLQGVPGARWVATRPGAVVGRSVLQLAIDRAAQPGGPPFRLDAEVLRRATRSGTDARAAHRTARRRRRGDTVGVGAHVGPTRRTAHRAQAHRIDRPIEPTDVRLIASEGFALWEPAEPMVWRNRRITLAYADLSERLAHAIGGSEGPRDANWFTFATWSSRTIGTYLEDIPLLPHRLRPRRAAGAGAGPGPTGRVGLPGSGGRGDRVGRAGQVDLAARPGPVPGDVGPAPAAAGAPDGLVARLARRIMLRSNASSFRILAAGNRLVFLEVGLAGTTFLELFPKRSAAAGEAGDQLWDTFWTKVEDQLEDLGMLDPSWLLTPSPPPDAFRLGFRQYFEAMRTDDPHERSQRVLAGNLLLGAYEQQRLDGYIWAALALFSTHAMERLIRDRTGRVGGVRRWPSNAYAWLMTRRMTLQLPDEVLAVDEPVPPPPRWEDRWEELATDADVTLPVLQALITRFQLAGGRYRDRGARNWTSYDQRMCTIGNLFRLRQRQASLFAPPFDEDLTARLVGPG
ncbi:MAG TPA: oxygenase MpaB family protein [Acidimicrobiales bacterium]